MCRRLIGLPVQSRAHWFWGKTSSPQRSSWGSLISGGGVKQADPSPPKPFCQTRLMVVNLISHHRNETMVKTSWFFCWHLCWGFEHHCLGFLSSVLRFLDFAAIRSREFPLSVAFAGNGRARGGAEALQAAPRGGGVAFRFRGEVSRFCHVSHWTFCQDSYKMDGFLLLSLQDARNKGKADQLALSFSGSFHLTNRGFKPRILHTASLATP